MLLSVFTLSPTFERGVVKSCDVLSLQFSLIFCSEFLPTRCFELAQDELTSASTSSTSSVPRLRIFYLFLAGHFFHFIFQPYCLTCYEDCNTLLPDSFCLSSHGSYTVTKKGCCRQLGRYSSVEHHELRLEYYHNPVTPCHR